MQFYRLSTVGTDWGRGDILYTGKTPLDSGDLLHHSMVEQSRESDMRCWWSRWERIGWPTRPVEGPHPSWRFDVLRVIRLVPFSEVNALVSRRYTDIVTTSDVMRKLYALVSCCYGFDVFVDVLNSLTKCRPSTCKQPELVAALVQTVYVNNDE